MLPNPDLWLNSYIVRRHSCQRQLISDSPLLSVASPEITAPISSELKKEFTVLLIDDRRDTMIPLQTLLAKDGHRVEVAQNGLMGVKKAQECKPDLILCDLGLPGEMDGWDVIKAIRNDPILERVYGGRYERQH